MLCPHACLHTHEWMWGARRASAGGYNEKRTRNKRRWWMRVYVGYIFRSPWEYSLKPELWLKFSKGGAELERGPERLKWAARPSHCGVNHWRRLPNQTFLLSLCWHQPWVFSSFSLLSSSLIKGIHVQNMVFFKTDGHLLLVGILLMVC